MNVLMLLSQLEITGAEVYAATISDKLIEKGHKVFIISDTLTVGTKAVYFPLDFNNRSFFNRLKHLKYVINFIKKHKIDIIHAHSRASGYIGYFASRLQKIPMITTIHGLQPVHLSRKIFKNFGDMIFPVCENLENQLLNEFKIDSEKITLLRNGFELPQIVSYSSEKEKIISIMGRLSGPKKDIALEIIKQLIKQNLKDFRIYLIGGKELPVEFNNYKDKFTYFSNQKSLVPFIRKSSVVFASGRIAVESILQNVPTFAIGESTLIGYVRDENIMMALTTNFGDILKPTNFKWEKFSGELNLALNSGKCSEKIIETVKNNFDVNIIADKIEAHYFREIIKKRNYEVPILMYHRVIKNIEEAGKHGIFITEKLLDKHFNYLKINGYCPITFRDLDKIDRLDKNKKFIILTFDDGYEDNYRLLFPLLKKYNFTAVIFLVSSLEYNQWDSDNFTEEKLFLMNEKQIKEMQDYGIEFGAHTKTHKDLTKISINEAKIEISESKYILEGKLQKEIISFAYPYGAYDSQIKDLVKCAGFKYGIATDNGPLYINDDFYEVRRINVFNNTNIFRFSRKVRGNYNFIKNKQKIKLIGTKQNY